MKESDSPFKEVRLASDYLKQMANLLGVELQRFAFEEFEKASDGTLKIGFSYYTTTNCYYNSSEQIRKTVFVKNGEVTAVRSGTIAAVDMTEHV